MILESKDKAMPMKKIKVTSGVYWVEIPQAGLYILCGCPADSVKHLAKVGLIHMEETNGVPYQSGPNAILLSELPIQNEKLANLAEFPVLQMLYGQGMFLPGHPNNTGAKPLLIGCEKQIDAQVNYIHRGNYGLISLEEIMQTGIPEAQAKEMMRVKLRFAFDTIRPTSELLDTRIVGSQPVELKNGVSIRRVDINKYEFLYKDQSLFVDLNLRYGEEYEAPYDLGFHQVRREYFSIIHMGEGDGWDCNRPCMGSLIAFQGKLYLIDAGPNSFNNLRALGISVNEIEGVFQTHAHDDHFNGLTVLLRADHRLKYFCVPLVRASVMKKLSALLNMSEDRLSQYFEIHDLEMGKWNNIEGLEVKPSYSPHPVENTILFFRALWNDGFKVYAHLADIATFRVMEEMVNENPDSSGITRGCWDRIRQEYLTPANIKKLDIGGGLIHGCAEDFKNDPSHRILLSHTSRKLTDVEKAIGSSASFGMIDVLIPTDQDYLKVNARKHFRCVFPNAPEPDLKMLLNEPLVIFNPGTILVKPGQKNLHMYYVLSGSLEFIDPDRQINNKLSAGSMVGELSGILGTASNGAFRAISHVATLEIPCALFTEFLNRNGYFDSARKDILARHFLQTSWLFGEMISCPVKSQIIKSARINNFKSGDLLNSRQSECLFLVESGQVQIYSGKKSIQTLTTGGFFGEEWVLTGDASIFQAQVTTNATLWEIPVRILSEIPVVQWKMIETLEKRKLQAGY